MIALLKFLWTGHWPCRHKWKKGKEIFQRDYYGGAILREYNKYELTCERCGEMKVKRMV